MLRSNMKKQGGFTLIELMFTVVVLAVLLSIGIPNLRDFLRNGRMTGYANELLADINLARTEAVKRRALVTICASANPTATSPTCAATNSTTAFTGWVVYVDDADPNAANANDGNATIDAGETILRRHDTITATAKSDAGFLSFADSGFARASGGTTSATRIVICDSRGNVESGSDRSAARALIIARTGRPGVTRSVSDITGLGGC
jgi:type IV fimbrial biogenesis protein FimT